MPPDQHPIPREALPPGWGLSTSCDGGFVYRHSHPPIELVADRTAAEQSHPGLGLSRYWELRYRFLLGDRSITEPVGRVSTRRAAVEGVLECMHHIHDSVDEPADPIEVQAALDSVSLSDTVPDDVDVSPPPE